MYRIPSVFSLVIVVSLVLVLTVGIVSAATVTPNITYQGKLTDAAGNPLTGSYRMTFKIYDISTGGTALSTDTHSVTATDGLVTTSIAHNGIFDVDGRALWLGITVGADPEMVPRQEIRPVPYALSLVPGAWIAGTDTDSALHLKNTWRGDGLNPVSALYAYTTGTQSRGIYARSTGSGSVGVYATTTNTSSTGVSAYTSGRNSEGFFAYTSGPGSSGVRAMTTNTSSYGVSASTSGQNSHGVYSKTTGPDSEGVYTYTSGTNSDGVFAFTTGPHSNGVRVMTIEPFSDGVNVSTSNQNSRGVISTTTGPFSEGVWAFTTGPSSKGVYAGTLSDDSNGVMVVTHGKNSAGVRVDTFNETSPGVIVQTRGQRSRGIWGVSNQDVGVYGEGATRGVEGKSTNGPGVFGTSTSLDGVTGGSRDLYGVSGYSTNSYGVYGSTVNGIYGVYTPDKMSALAYDTNGADVAEYMPVTGDVTAGTVMIIGPDGKLRISNSAYDTGVAGIVSTAPGVSLGAKEAGNPGEQIIAVAGRVPCKVDASNGPVHPRDLLTTSNTPGYAMKATDPKTGTILGKAMGTLESGTGTIEVLVTLQ